MKAAVVRELGPPEVLRYEDAPAPVPGPDEVLIAVEAISIEGADRLARTIFPLPRVPHIIGYQAGGRVEAVGQNIRNVKVGQRVVGFSLSGAYAEKFCVAAPYVFPVPDDLDIRVAATVPSTFGTADAALFEFGELKPREAVFIHGGAGGVGLAAIQLAKAAGATVLATARGSVRAARLEEYGADHAIAYDMVDYAEVVLRETDGAGADLIVDLAGGNGAAVSKLITAARHRGRLAVVGLASGEPPSVGFWDLVGKSLTVYGIGFVAEIPLPRTHERIARHMAAAASGELRMPIDREFPLTQAAEAHRYIETSRPFGRVLLRP